MAFLRRHIQVGFATALTLAALCMAPAVALADAGSAPDSQGAAQPDQQIAEAAIEASLEQQFQPPEEVRVGDRLALSLRVTHPTDTEVLLPDSFGNPRWELVGTDRDSVVDEARQITTLTLTFQIFRPGLTRLPALTLTILASGQETIELATEPVEVKVVSVLPADETPEMHPHRHPVAVWTDDYTLAWVGGILFGALIAAALTWLIVGRREQDEVGPPPRPAHVVALEKLSALTTGELLDEGEYMLFYVRMSGAVREYLGRRYGFRGTELTTTEILVHLEEVDWPAGLSLVDVREWLEHCDLIKFSGVQPSRDRAQQALRRGFSIVELTRPSEEQEEEEKGKEKEGVDEDVSDAAEASDEAKASDEAEDTDEAEKTGQLEVAEETQEDNDVDESEVAEEPEEAATPKEADQSEVADGPEDVEKTSEGGES